ncbi:MAG TPA: pentapeptide repeat-containing protein, partial [Spirochaetota bacterium]|nr:pentapeptide repeat-containing protein [Spirochaetota bacterium]
MKRLRKKSAILLIIFFSMAGISCIHAVRIPFIRGSLNNSELFQKNYGDKPQTLILATIPEDQWKNVTLKKWNFSRTTFRYTQFDNVTFDNCTFDNITFLKLIVTNCRFINCRFEKCTVASGKWIKCSFTGGSINTMMFIPYKPSGNDYWYSWVTWEDLSFESMRIEKL